MAKETLSRKSFQGRLPGRDPKGPFEKVMKKNKETAAEWRRFILSGAIRREVFSRFARTPRTEC